MSAFWPALALFAVPVPDAAVLARALSPIEPPPAYPYHANATSALANTTNSLADTDDDLAGELAETSSPGPSTRSTSATQSTRS
jgi:hypothetical protein